MEAFEAFLATYPTRAYAKGAVILHQDDVPPCAYVVKSGVIKIYDISALGDERLVLFDQAREFFPIAWIVGQRETSQFFYEAYTDVVVYKVPRDDIVAFLKKHPDSLYDVYVDFIERYVAFQARILGLEQTKASDKVLFNLDFLTSRFGKKINDSQTDLSLPLTQQDLANYVGLTRETTSIELKKLERKGVIHKTNSRYVISVKKLRSLLFGKRS